MFKKFMNDKRGNVVQYILVLAVVLVIAVFFFTSEKKQAKKEVEKTETNINSTMESMS